MSSACARGPPEASGPSSARCGAEKQSQDKLRFDHVVHNDQVERAVAELLSTLERELDA